MNREEIKKILPHREPMLLVDEVSLEGEMAVGYYKVKGDEWFLQGHFPGNPVVPGVVLCEMMAQCCCILIGQQSESGNANNQSADGNKSQGNSQGDVGGTPYFTGLNNIKFRNPVKPGDVVKLECTMERIKEPFYFAKGKGSVDGKICVGGDFSFALIK